MGVFEDTITKAREIIGETGRATGELIEVQKLKFSASSLKSAIRKNYELLGQYTYLSVVNDEDNATAVEELVSEITEQKQQLKQLEKKIADCKGKVVCSCGCVNSENASYCSGCGKEL